MRKCLGERKKQKRNEEAKTRKGEMPSEGKEELDRKRKIKEEKEERG